jgi:hypothetical protein
MGLREVIKGQREVDEGVSGGKSLSYHRKIVLDTAL